MLHPERVTAPAAFVTLEEARSHVRNEDSRDADPVIQRCLNAAIAALDGWNGILTRCIATQVWKSFHPGFPTCGILPLPMDGATSIASVTYIDEAGAAQTLAPASYRLESPVGSTSRLARPVNLSWPSTEVRADAVTITASYGWPVVDVPHDIKEAVLLLTSHYFENRGAAVFGGGFGVLPMGVEPLIAKYRNPWMADAR
jgi:uncharacterized phiE125 gp8 family phage protein